MMTMAELELLRDSIIAGFRAQRDYILDNAHANIEFQTKSDNSLVTEVDRAVENALMQRLNQLFPDLQIFGEEGGYMPNNLPQSFVLIDPIDGTSSFIEGTPAFTCMAVYIENQEAKLSVIYNPTTDDLYHALRGRGAFKNDQRLQLQGTQMPPKVFAKGRFITELNKLLQPLRLQAEKGPSGAGFGFSLVAEGAITARFQLQSRGQLHDYATGALLVTEAGGSVIPIMDDTYTIYCKSFVACHPDFADIVRDNRERFKEFDSEAYADSSL